MAELLFIHEKTNWSINDGFGDYLFNETMQRNDSLVLCLYCWGGVGWGGSSLRRRNISNANPKYLQAERVINGSCNYSPDYHPSDPASGQSIVLGSPSIVAYLNDNLSFPAIVCSKL